MYTINKNKLLRGHVITTTCPMLTAITDLGNQSTVLRALCDLWRCVWTWVM